MLDVLCQHRLIKRGEHEIRGLNWQAMFEGNPSAAVCATASTTTAAATAPPTQTL